MKTRRTKIVTSYVGHEEVQSAMKRFFDSGGKITKIKNPCQEILLKKDMDEEDSKYIDPHAANPSRNGLGEVGNIVQQELQMELKEV